MSGTEHELEMDELTEITQYIQDKAGEDAEMIFGHGVDETLGQSIRVTVIATGFAREAHTIATPGQRSAVEAAPEPAERQFAGTAGAPAAPFVPSFGPPPAEPARVHLALEGPGLPSNTPPLTGQPATGPGEPVLLPANSTTAPARLRPMDIQAEERRRRMQELSHGLPLDAVTQYEAPAYLRRQVKLETVVPSSEQSISRFNLSDDNELLGDNRFLHDNVD